MKLTKNGRTVIVQGMVHHCFPFFYSIVQKELDLAQENNMQIIAEGVDMEQNRTLSSRYLEAWFNYGNELTRYIGLSNQHVLNYPENTNWIDVTGSEVSEVMYAHKTRRDIAKKRLSRIRLMQKKTQSWIIFVILAFYLFVIINTLVHIPSIIIPLAIIVLVTNWIKTRKENKVLLDKRNRVVVDFINNSDAKELYVMYGFAHLRGMRKLLKASDWK